jgi:hypothetical protein
MLKIIYTDTGLHLERLSVDRTQWIDRRIEFADSVGEPLSVSRQRATFPLPLPVCEFPVVDSALDHLEANTVTIDRCDLDYVEVGLAGYWLSTDLDSAEGIFVCQQTDRVELSLWQMWHAVQGVGGI